MFYEKQNATKNYKKNIQRNLYITTEKKYRTVEGKGGCFEK